MSWENIRIKYIEYGIPLFLYGMIILAIGVILVFLAGELMEALYLIADFLIILGGVMIVIFSPSFLFIGREINNEL